MVGLSDRNLKPLWALEIKWSDRYIEKPSELKSLVSFCKECSLKSALVTTVTKTGTVEYDGVTLQFVPASAYAYTVGRNTLVKKKLQ